MLPCCTSTGSYPARPRLLQGNYTDKGYVSKEPSSLSEGVPGLPFLVGTVLALFGALGYVVSQT